MTDNKPYISIVVTSRNDDHSYNMGDRMRLCINGIIEQMEKYEIPSELLFVEWLPSSNKPLIRDVYEWPKQLKYCNIRVIVVPPSEVGEYEWSDDYSYRDLTPWNVGIRRARGEFILSTVIDVIFSNDLVRFISQKKLDKNKMYRIDRMDVDRDVTNLDSLDEQLRYCERRVIDRHSPYSFALFLKNKIFKKRLPVLHNYAPGDFMLFSRERWNLIRGFPEGVNPGADNILLYMAHLSGAEECVLRDPIRLYHMDHNSAWQKPSYVFLRRFFNKLGFPYKVSGMIARVGSKFIPSKSYLEKNRYRTLKRREVYKLMLDMVEGRRSYIYNDEKWGLGESNLEEFCISNKGI